MVLDCSASAHRPAVLPALVYPISVSSINFNLCVLPDTRPTHTTRILHVHGELCKWDLLLLILYADTYSDSVP